MKVFDDLLLSYRRKDDLITIAFAGVLSLLRDGTMIDLTARIKEHLTGNPDCQPAKVRGTSWGQTNECRHSVGSFNFRPTAELATITSCNLRFLTAWARATTTFHSSVISHWFQYSRTTSTSINLRIPTLPSVSLPFRWTAIMSGPLSLQYIGMNVQNDDNRQSWDSWHIKRHF
ncbi:hypothetical protein C8R48DRAFT_49807 [Suillus tomentosus]|nr:hypothetical protein C8R48DRAFT_49807 [Suillus tomentosus]